jgi:predicted CXXCH cytochrome family protein
LSIAWDARPQTAGGQRWFHLYPDERIAFDDELHWTQRAQTWNHMCAECHSTGFEKRYDEAARLYESRWAELDVACEACHGPASRHVAWARKDSGWEGIGEKGIAVPLDERRGVTWAIDPSTGNARRSMARSTEVEIETCGRCHARRSQLFEDDPSALGLTSSYLPALLREGVYHADGQIDAEDYEYGSFLQSRMYQAGVTCSDCHEPHRLALRAPGDAVCFQCHAAGSYASAGHHFHEAGSPGARCAGCHMPVKTYMVVDERHDHGFRVPRPDLSASLGTPNACAGCHAPQTAEWAADQVRRWLGRDARGMQRYGAELHAARSRTSDAEASLVALLQDASQPAIARATALAELGGWLSPRSLGAVATALRDPSPLVRLGALEALDALPPEERWRYAERLLADPARVVRALAASALADRASFEVSAEQKEAFARAADDYIQAQRFNADQPESRVNLGNFLAARGETAQAESAYRRAIEIDPSWVPAYVNLADLLRAGGRDSEGETVLAEGLRRVPESAALHHSRGLLFVRQNRRDAALEELERAVDLEPENGRFAYVCAIALDSAGRREDAEEVVRAALVRAPADRALLALRAQLAARD